MSKDVQPVAGKNEIVVYQPEGGEFHIEVRVENETVWLTQAQMAELFNSTRNNITLHIKNIFQEHELDANSVCKESLRKSTKRRFTTSTSSFQSVIE